MRINAPKGYPNLRVVAKSRHQNVFFEPALGTTIRALNDGRIMEVLKKDDAFTDSMNDVYDANIHSDRSATIEETIVKTELVEKQLFPLLIWKQKQLQAAENEKIRFEETVVSETRNIEYVRETSGFDFSFLDTFR